MKNTIVFGFDSYNSAGSIRCLGEANINPIAIIVSSKSKTAVSRSKYIKTYHQVGDIESGIELLQQLKIDGIKQYIFATSDKIATALDNVYDKLIGHFIFPNCGRQGALTEMMNKASMCKIAEESGITVPYSIAYKGGDPIPETLKFPCLVKPLKSISGSKQDIRHFYSKSELENYFKYDHITKEYLIQQFIKKEYEILVIGCRTESGYTLLPAYLHVSRSVCEGDVDSAGFISTGLPPNLNYEAIDKFLNKLNYIGTFSIELGVENGCAYFFEINLRNDGTINYYTKIGINVPEMWINDESHVNYSQSSSKAFYIDEFGDFLNVLRGDISLKNWLGHFRQSTIFKYYDSKDNGPFRRFAPMQMRIVFSSILRKITGRL